MLFKGCGEEVRFNTETSMSKDNKNSISALEVIGAILMIESMRKANKNQEVTNEHLLEIRKDNLRSKTENDFQMEFGMTMQQFADNHIRVDHKYRNYDVCSKCQRFTEYTERFREIGNLGKPQQIKREEREREGAMMGWFLFIGIIVALVVALTGGVSPPSENVSGTAAPAAGTAQAPTPLTDSAQKTEAPTNTSPGEAIDTADDTAVGDLQVTTAAPQSESTAEKPAPIEPANAATRPGPYLYAGTSPEYAPTLPTRITPVGPRQHRSLLRRIFRSPFHRHSRHSANINPPTKGLE
jgi:hypothetical protein